MVSKSVFACALVAAAGTVASAGVFSWSAGDGSWGDHTNWFGPAGQVPHLTVDSASVGTQHADVLIESSIALGSLHVFNDSSVYTHTGSLFVAGDVLLEDSNQALVVSDGPATRDFDADTVTVRDTYMVMAGGTAQIDEALNLETAGVLGVGVVEMNGSGDFDLGPGTLWATYHPSGDTLTVRRTGSSTAELDWSDPASNILAWDGATLDIEIPVSGVFAGDMNISEGSTVRVADPIIAGASSQITLWGGDVWDVDAEAVLEAPVVDSYGLIDVLNGESIIRSPLVALHGTAELGEDTYLRLESTAVILDSFVVTSPDGTGGNIHFDGTQTVNVTGGTTSVTTGQFGLFDLDGSGDMAVSIAGDSALWLDVHHIQSFQVDTFSGTLNVAGLFHLVTYQSAPTWQNQGEINLDGGEITGRTLENEGVISGSGAIEAELFSNGQLVADGGTLFVNNPGDSTLGIIADSDPSTGVLRAETGDMVLAVPDGNIGYFFKGDAFIGNGEGVREVMETNGVFWISDEGSMSLNGGFFRAKQVQLDGELFTQGVSMLRATESDWEEGGVIFDWGSVSTISGTLEIDGHASTRRTHQFNGEGNIRAVSPVRVFDFADDTDMADVSFASAGRVTFDEQNDGLGQATVAGFELEPTATLEIDFGSDTEGFYDSIAAQDAAVLGGTLQLSPWYNAVPEAGDTITILTAPSVTGEFAEVDDSAFGWRRRAEVSVEPNRVDVTFYCAADLNSDGIVDLGDVTMFTQAFTANDMAADLYAPHGLLDLSDVLAFIELVNNGCD